MGKRFWLILAVVILVFVGVFVISNRHADKSSGIVATPGPDTITATDHVRGNQAAKVTLVEYGDFQCPACGNAYPIVKQLEAAFPADLRMVFRHFPLTNIHPNAFSGARAAEAAGVQGKFFEMHDILYEHQSDWSTGSDALSKFRIYAKELGLDINKFNDDYGTNATSGHINSNIQSGKNAQVDATPTFYLNGKKVDPNPRSLEEFQAKVQALLTPAQ